MGKDKTIKAEIKKNYRKTATVITAAIGETILRSWSIIIFCIKIGLDIETSTFFLLMSLTPYISVIVNALFKGETKDVEVENKILKAERSSRKEMDDLFYRQVRDFSEVNCQLAAKTGVVPDSIKAVNDWKIAQDKIKEINSAETTKLTELPIEKQAEVKRLVETPVVSTPEALEPEPETQPTEVQE